MGRACQHSDTRSDDPFETSVICDLGPSGRSGNSIDLVVAAATEREPPTAYHRLPFQYGHVAVVIGGLQYSMISGRVVLKPAGTILCMAVDPIDYSVIGALAVVPEAAIDPVYAGLMAFYHSTSHVDIPTSPHTALRERHVRSSTPRGSRDSPSRLLAPILSSQASIFRAKQVDSDSSHASSSPSTSRTRAPRSAACRQAAASKANVAGSRKNTQGATPLDLSALGFTSNRAIVVEDAPVSVSTRTSTRRRTTKTKGPNQAGTQSNTAHVTDLASDSDVEDAFGMNQRRPKSSTSATPAASASSAPSGSGTSQTTQTIRYQIVQADAVRPGRPLRSMRQPPSYRHIPREYYSLARFQQYGYAHLAPLHQRSPQDKLLLASPPKNTITIAYGVHVDEPTAISGGKTVQVMRMTNGKGTVAELSYYRDPSLNRQRRPTNPRVSRSIRV